MTKSIVLGEPVDEDMDTEPMGGDPAAQDQGTFPDVGENCLAHMMLVHDVAVFEQQRFSSYLSAIV